MHFFTPKRQAAFEHGGLMEKLREEKYSIGCIGASISRFYEDLQIKSDFKGPGTQQ